MTRDPTLFTLTANMLAETTAYYDDIGRLCLLGETHRAVSESFQVGGKGINVARMAHRLGMDVQAIVFPRGHTGARCMEWISNSGVRAVGFPMCGETRAGWVIRSQHDPSVTFLGADQATEEASWIQALNYIEESIQAGDVFALCGSIPGWRPSIAEPLREFIQRIAPRVLVCVDTYGKPLRDLTDLAVGLVKINRDEFTTLLDSEKEALVASEMTFLEKTLRDFARTHAPSRWVITNRSQPVIACDELGTVFSIKPPTIVEVSSVGCGDVLLAGLINELVHGQDLCTALRCSIPFASADAMQTTIADVDFELARSLQCGPLRAL